MTRRAGQTVTSDRDHRDTPGSDVLMMPGHPGPAALLTRDIQVIMMIIMMMIPSTRLCRMMMISIIVLRA